MIRQTRATREWPVYFELEDPNQYSGGVHFFCSEQCREIAPTAEYNCNIKAGTQSESEMEAGTTCENCGKYLIAPEGVSELRQFYQPTTGRITTMRKISIFLLGIREFRQTMTTSFDDPEIEVYDRGRELAHRLTLRLFEES
jgi:hypothetical protein